MLEVLLSALSAMPWEAIRNWATSIGGLIALFIAVLTYRGNARTRRQEQARLVYFTTSSPGRYEAGSRFQTAVDPVHNVFISGVEYKEVEPSGTHDYVVTSPTWMVPIVVHNLSRELIGPVVLELVDSSPSSLHPRILIPLDFVEPAATVTRDVHFAGPAHDTDYVPKLDATMSFMDATGKWWRRRGNSPLSKGHPVALPVLPVQPLDAARVRDSSPS